MAIYSVKLHLAFSPSMEVYACTLSCSYGSGPPRNIFFSLTSGKESAPASCFRVHGAGIQNGEGKTASHVETRGLYVAKVAPFG